MMNKALLGLTFLLIAQIACGSSAPTVKTANDYIQEYGGNADVYNAILSLTDCAALQEQFDIASENNQRETPGTPGHKQTLGYMTAADDRMKGLNCYDQSNPALPIVDVSTIVAGTAEMAITQTAMAF